MSYEYNHSQLVKLFLKLVNSSSAGSLFQPFTPKPLCFFTLPTFWQHKLHVLSAANAASGLTSFLSVIFPLSHLLYKLYNPNSFFFFFPNVYSLKSSLTVKVPKVAFSQLEYLQCTAYSHMEVPGYILEEISLYQYSVLLPLRGRAADEPNRALPCTTATFLQSVLPPSDSLQYCAATKHSTEQVHPPCKLSFIFNHLSC